MKQVKCRRKHTLAASPSTPALTTQHGSSACQLTGLHSADASSSLFWGNPHGLAAFRSPKSAQCTPSSGALSEPQKAALALLCTTAPRLQDFLGTSPDELACRQTLHGWQESAIGHCSLARSIYQKKPAVTANTHVFRFCSNFLLLFAGHVGMLMLYYPQGISSNSRAQLQGIFHSRLEISKKLKKFLSISLL